MTESDKQKLISQLAAQWCDAMDIESLMNYFIEQQETYLNSLSDTELLVQFQENNVLE